VTAVPAPASSPDAGATWHYGDPLGEQRAALTDAVFIDRSHRGVITLTGPDRLTWLNNMSSQHIADLAEGATVENLSLDAHGRVEDHWIQTELGGVSHLDTEPWRAEPLLAYLKRMVFWAQVVPDAADDAVLSLLGPGLSDKKVLDALGIDALPEDIAAPLPQGFVRRMPTHADGPAVARLAAESGIDPSALVGTGKGGRVTKGDMLQAIAGGVGAAASATATSASMSVAPLQLRVPTPPDDASREERVRMTKLRQTIARRL